VRKLVNLFIDLQAFQSVFVFILFFLCIQIILIILYNLLNSSTKKEVEIYNNVAIHPLVFIVWLTLGITLISISGFLFYFAILTALAFGLHVGLTLLLIAGCALLYGLLLIKIGKNYQKINDQAYLLSHLLLLPFFLIGFYLLLNRGTSESFYLMFYYFFVILFIFAPTFLLLYSFVYRSYFRSD
jgi:hypothetical protein